MLVTNSCRLHEMTNQSSGYPLIFNEWGQNSQSRTRYIMSVLDNETMTNTFSFLFHFNVLIHFNQYSQIGLVEIVNTISTYCISPNRLQYVAIVFLKKIEEKKHG